MIKLVEYVAQSGSPVVALQEFQENNPLGPFCSDSDPPVPLRHYDGFPVPDYLLGSPWNIRFRPRYGHSVAIGLAPRRQSRVNASFDVLARFR